MNDDDPFLQAKFKYMPGSSAYLTHFVSPPAISVADLRIPSYSTIISVLEYYRDCLIELEKMLYISGSPEVYSEVMPFEVFTAQIVDWPIGEMIEVSYAMIRAELFSKCTFSYWKVVKEFITLCIVTIKYYNIKDKDLGLILNNEMFFSESFAWSITRPAVGLRQKYSRIVRKYDKHVSIQQKQIDNSSGALRVCGICDDIIQEIAENIPVKTGLSFTECRYADNNGYTVFKLEGSAASRPPPQGESRNPCGGWRLSTRAVRG